MVVVVVVSLNSVAGDAAGVSARPFLSRGVFTFMFASTIFSRKDRGVCVCVSRVICVNARRRRRRFGEMCSVSDSVGWGGTAQSTHEKHTDLLCATQLLSVCYLSLSLSLSFTLVVVPHAVTSVVIFVAGVCESSENLAFVEQAHSMQSQGTRDSTRGARG